VPRGEPIAYALDRADERHLVDERIRDLGRRLALLAVEEQILDLTRLRLVPVAREQVVVEILAARAHAADVERVVLLQHRTPRVDVVGHERGNRGRDVEPVARAIDWEHRARLLRRPEDRQPAVGDLERLLDRLRPDRRKVDRNVGPERPRHQLQRLAEPGAALHRNVVMHAVMLEPFPSQHRAHDLDVLARLAERLPPLLPVPALDDLRAGRAEAHQEPSAREQVERRSRHRRVRG
jgi:hypothetical protein